MTEKFSPKESETAKKIAFDNMEELSKISSKYFTVFFKVFWNNKLSTSQKINNISALMHQLEEDPSVIFTETEINNQLQIGKQEELSFMLFFLKTLNRRVSLTTSIQGHRVVFT